MPPIKTKASPKDKVKREIIYPDIHVELAIGEHALTAEKAKALLGWTTDVNEAKKWGVDAPLCLDREKKNCFALNNLHNRPLYMSSVDSLVQEILNKRWEFNGEPIIIGKYGSILNGQHSLIALVLAQQDVDLKPDMWDFTTKPVSIDKQITFGVNEDDKVVNTMDTCKPRSIMDVIYRCEFFKDLPPDQRKHASRISDYAIRLLWERTGASQDAWAPRRTHTEAIDFMTRHDALKKCIQLIMIEDKGKGITDYKIGQGSAAAMLYLMAASKSDLDKYAADPKEENIDLSLMKKAEDFWKMFSNRKLDAFKVVRQAVASTMDTDPEKDDGGCGSFIEKLCVIAKAWRLYISNTPFKKNDLKLAYKENNDGIRQLKESGVTFGGIDKGIVKDEPDPIQEEKEAKKEEMANAVPPPKEDAKESPEAKLKQIKDDLARIARENKGATVIMKRKEGGYTAWEGFADSISKVINGKVDTLPNGLRRILLSHSDWEKHKETIFSKLGKVVLIALERVGQNAEPKETVTILNEAKNIRTDSTPETGKKAAPKKIVRK